MILGDVRYGTPRCISRIVGSEIVLLGCDKHVAILEYNPIGRQFNLLNTLLNLHERKVCSIFCSGSYLFSKAHGENLLKVTKFDSEPPSDMVKHYQPSNLYYNPSSNINHEDVQYLDPNCQYKILGSNKIQIGHKNMEKVVSSPDGEKLYVGGSGLHMLRF